MIRRVGLLLSLMLAACASDRDAASTPVVPDGTPTAIEDSARFSVGVVEGDTTRQFHRVVGPFLLPDGKLAVPVAGDLAIRVFTPDGELARTLGGPGEGPGEIAALNAAWARGDTIEAFDHELRRITRYLPGGTTEAVRLEVIASAQAAVPEAPSEGWILVGVADGGIGRRDEVAVHRFERDGSHAGVIARAEGMTRFRTPVADGPDPLSPRAAFAVHENEVYVAETLTARIRVLDLNGTLKREIAWKPAELPSPEDAFRSVVDAVTARRAPDDRAAARRRLESFEVQDRVSVFWDLMVDEEGFIWVQPFDPDRHALALTGYGGTAPGGEWMILSPDGERVGTIRMPERLRPTHITADAVAGVRRNAVGVEFVDVHSLERSRR